MQRVSIGLRIILALVFFGAGSAKLLSVAAMVEGFEAIGFGQWFRFFTAGVEIFGAILLWVPRAQFLGAALLGATMIGAILAHQLILGPSAFPAAVLGVGCASILFIHWDQAVAFLSGRQESS